MRKRICSILLTACLLLGLLPTTVLAEDANADALYVNGVDMLGGGTLDGVSYDRSSNTLTLSSITIDTYYSPDETTRAGIYYQGTDTLNIVSNGSNTVQVKPTGDGGGYPAAPVYGYGLYAEGSVVLSGSSLTFQAGTIDNAYLDAKDSGNECFVFAEAIHVTGDLDVTGTVTERLTSFPLETPIENTQNETTYAAATLKNDYAIYVGGRLNVLDGTLTGTRLKVDGETGISGTLSASLLSAGNIGVTSGSMDVNGLTAEDITLGGGKLTSKRITAHDLTVTGGTLETSASTSSTTLTGMIELSGTATFSSGTVTVNSTDYAGIMSAAKPDSYLFTEGDCIASGDAVVTVDVHRESGGPSGIAMGGHVPGLRQRPGHGHNGN